MKVSSVKAAAACAAALTMASAVATPAHAINRVHDNCNRANSGHFLYIESQGNRVCFANAGTVDVALYGVTYIHSGNNSVLIATVLRQGDSQDWTLNMDKDAVYNLNPIHKITRIRIKR